MYWRRPLSRLEAALYVAIAALAAALLLERMLSHLALAERAALEASLANTQSALALRLAYERLQGDRSREREWADRNPFELAGMRLANYAGEIEGPEAAVPARGEWAYDRGRRELLYRPRNRRGLAIEGGAEALRFRLVLSPEGGAPRLEPVQRYRWEP